MQMKGITTVDMRDTDAKRCEQQSECERMRSAELIAAVMRRSRSKTSEVQEGRGDVIFGSRRLGQFTHADYTFGYIFLFFYINIYLHTNISLVYYQRLS